MNWLTRVCNYYLAKRFVDGRISGANHHGTMSIKGNKLYSYDKCIAMRHDNIFTISNKASFLGGKSYSHTTSRHISDIYCACRSAKIKIKLVIGWADGNVEDEITPNFYTHKTKVGVIKAFRIMRSCAVEPSGWSHDNNKLSIHNEVVAIRDWKVGSCNSGCDECPVRFECKTDGEGYYGYIFYIAKGQHADTVKKYLHPYAIVEDLTRIGA